MKWDRIMSVTCIKNTLNYVCRLVSDRATHSSYLNSFIQLTKLVFLFLFSFYAHRWYRFSTLIILNFFLWYICLSHIQRCAIITLICIVLFNFIVLSFVCEVQIMQCPAYSIPFSPSYFVRISVEMLIIVYFPPSIYCSPISKIVTER